MGSIVRHVRDSQIAKITVTIYVLLSMWWLFIFWGGTQDAYVNHLFGFVYGGFAIWGGFIGVGASRSWGGAKSTIGRAIVALSIGLLLQAFGQYSFWFMQSILGVEIPYPSIPDIGFFGTIPFYIYAGFELARSAGAHVSLRSFGSKIQIVLIPLFMLLFSYVLFLRNYVFDWSEPLIIFFDFAYPMGQALFISTGILAYSLSWKILGGVMKDKILLLVVAFFFQYLSDYTFVYFQDTFFPAHFVDFIYMTAYFLMTLSLIQLKVVSDELRSTPASKSR